MHFRIEQRFAGSVDAVESAFVDPAYLARLASLPKLGTPKLVHRVDAGPLVHLWVQYRFTGELSSAVRSVVDPTQLTWVEESTLDRRVHRTTWRIVPDRYKGLLRAAGTFTLEADGAATRRVTEAELKVSMPLVSGKVEKAIVSGLRQHAAQEEQVMAAWLATTRGA